MLEKNYYQTNEIYVRFCQIFIREKLEWFNFYRRGEFCSERVLGVRVQG